MALQIKKAIKFEARGRVALVGPPGSGKTYTALKLARQLAGPEGKILGIDTEHGSMAKYADLFDFDVIELTSYSQENFNEAMDLGEQGGYAVIVPDSLSHFWVGKDGALEFVDMAGKRHKDNMGGWKDFRPHERKMVDRMLASPAHIVVTMRTKTEYAEQVDERGKKKRVKIGLAPVQREGLEYEFDLVGYMDEDNTFITDKTRCPFYSQKALTKPGDVEFAPFVEWLKGVKREETPAIPVPTPAANALDPAGNETLTPTSDVIQTELKKQISARNGFANFAVQARAQLVHFRGETLGALTYDALLKHHGGRDTVKSSAKAALACATDLLLAIEDAKADAAFEATLADQAPARDEHEETVATEQAA